MVQDREEESFKRMCSPRPRPKHLARSPCGAPETESERIPLSPMRRVIAQRMVESKTTTPHFYLTVELDVAKLLEFRAQANESLAIPAAANSASTILS